jgi:short-subunit dehydrogenase
MLKRTDRAAKRRVRDDGWRLPDELWAEMEPLLPPRPAHPLGCHNPRVPDRSAMDAIFFVLRTGCQWNFVTDTELGEELNLIQLNVASTVHLAKRVLPDMAARNKGHVLFTASVAGTMPTPLEAVYGASKAFVLSFAESLRYELKDKGVNVTALLPGPTDTNFFHRAGMDDTQVGSEGKEENSPTEVARQGFEALMAGKEKVVAGSTKLKLQQAVGTVLPDSVKAAQHKGMAEPGSAKQ